MDIGRLVPTAWSPDDLRTVANLIVTAMVGIVEAIVFPDRPGSEAEIIRRAERQLQMLVWGIANWRTPEE
jgi:hypothetical protein